MVTISLVLISLGMSPFPWPRFHLGGFQFHGHIDISRGNIDVPKCVMNSDGFRCLIEKTGFLFLNFPSRCYGNWEILSNSNIKLATACCSLIGAVPRPVWWSPCALGHLWHAFDWPFLIVCLFINGPMKNMGNIFKRINHRGFCCHGYGYGLWWHQLIIYPFIYLACCSQGSLPWDTLQWFETSQWPWHVHPFSLVLLEKSFAIRSR